MYMHTCQKGTPRLADGCFSYHLVFRQQITLVNLKKSSQHLIERSVNPAPTSIPAYNQVWVQPFLATFSSRISFFWSNTNPPCGLPQACQYLKPFFLLLFFTSAISQHCLCSHWQYSKVRVSNCCLVYFWNFRGKSTLLTKEKQETLMTDIERWVNSHTRSQIIINDIATTGIELRSCRFPAHKWAIHK